MSFILLLSVARDMPRVSAVLSLLPEIYRVPVCVFFFHLVKRSNIMSLSAEEQLTTMSCAPTSGPAIFVRSSDGRNSQPLWMITARSSTFFNSRTLPGQSSPSESFQFAVRKTYLSPSRHVVEQIMADCGYVPAPLPERGDMYPLLYSGGRRGESLRNGAPYGLFYVHVR